MAEEQESQEKKGGSGKIVLFAIVGLVLVLILIGVVVILLLSGGGDEELEEAPKKEQKQAINKYSGSQNIDATLANVGVILPVTGKEQPLIINLATQGRDAYLSIQLSIGLSNDKLQPEVERKMDIIKDTFIDVFSTKTPEELKTSKGMNRALEEARSRINEFLIDGEVVRVFRTNAFIQQG